jgi:hypothetical protein
MKLSNYAFLDLDNKIKKYEFITTQAGNVILFLHLGEDRLINRVKILKPESNLNEI